MMPFLFKVLMLFSLVTLSGCSAVSLLNSIMPREGYTIRKDIAYGADPRQKLDIYIPNIASNNAPVPVIVFFYGGSWQKGSKDDYLFLGQAFASKGYMTVVADYRLYPKVSFPVFIEDGAEAFAWVHEHIAEYGGDPKKLYVSGHSAGAYIAMMLTLNPSYLQKAGAKKEWIRGTIGISGPYDFLPLTDEKLIQLFSTAKHPSDTQPITFATERYAPIFLATGDKDEDVLPRNSIILDTRLKKLDSPVETHIYPDIGHIDIMLSLAHGFRHKSPLLEDIDTFVSEN